MKMILMMVLTSMFLLWPTSTKADVGQVCVTEVTPPRVVQVGGEDALWMAVRLVPVGDVCHVNTQMFLDEVNMVYMTFTGVALRNEDFDPSDVCSHRGNAIHCQFVTSKVTEVGALLRGHRQGTVPVRVFDVSNGIDQTFGVPVWNYRIVSVPLVMSGHMISAVACESDDC